jgi:hypothetical protein
VDFKKVRRYKKAMKLSPFGGGLMKGSFIVKEKDNGSKIIY